MYLVFEEDAGSLDPKINVLHLGQYASSNHLQYETNNLE